MLSALPKTSTQCPWPGLEPGPLDLETSALTMRAPCLPLGIDTCIKLPETTPIPSHFLKAVQRDSRKINHMLSNQGHRITLEELHLACEQAPGGASAEQTFGAKRRAIGACTHSPNSPMSASKIWTQSGDWWILITHDVS